MTQKDAFDILKMGKNAFVTGPAGSGKTYVVNQYIKYLKDHEVPLGVTASTGIAATHMGGITIHSWSGIGVRDRLSPEDLEEIGERPYVRKKVEAARVLVIDEVSMLHHFTLDMVDRVIRHVKKNDLPFGGLQVVLCGDFFQLPPVARMGEPAARFIYESTAWKEGKFAVCYLEENHRHKNDPVALVLNEIRSGTVSEEARERLRERFLDSKGEPYIRMGDRTEPTRLYTHNIDVDAVNDRELSRINGAETIYEMASKGRKPLVEALKNSCLAPEILRLRKGARVMCVKNNFEKGYVNGTLGVVVSCGWNVDPVIRTASTPDHPEGELITIERAAWVIEDDGKTLAEISQYPLRLAWAITVHKSQGMSLDAVEVDLSKAFEPGMGYVALSRVRTLSGLSILGICENALMVKSDVLRYDIHLRESSQREERRLAGTHEAEITEAHKEFLARAAPLHSMGKKGNKPKIPKISTYEKTAMLVRQGEPLKAMAAARDVNEETIVDHIEWLMTGGKGTGSGLSQADIAYLKKEIPFSHFSRLEKALEEVMAGQEDDGRPPFLAPVKSKVGAAISWTEIRLARVLLGYIRKSSGRKDTPKDGCSS